jgi:hypothetical protein
MTSSMRVFLQCLLPSSGSSSRRAKRRSPKSSATRANAPNPPKLLNQRDQPLNEPILVAALKCQPQVLLHFLLLSDLYPGRYCFVLRGGLVIAEPHKELMQYRENTWDACEIRSQIRMRFGGPQMSRWAEADCNLTCCRLPDVCGATRLVPIESDLCHQELCQ